MLAAMMLAGVWWCLPRLKGLFIALIWRTGATGEDVFLPTLLSKMAHAKTARTAGDFMSLMKNDSFFHSRMKICLIFSFILRNDMIRKNCIVLWAPHCADETQRQGEDRVRKP